MRDRYQGGSLAGFIIIGVLLALVLVGGLYGLNRYNAQRASDEAARQEQSQSTEEKASPAPQQTTDVPKDEEAAPAVESDKKPAAPAPSTGSTAAPNAASTRPAANLPQTGPADTAVTLVAVSLLAFAGVHFVRSRRVRV